MVFGIGATRISPLPASSPSSPSESPPPPQTFTTRDRLQTIMSQEGLPETLQPLSAHTAVFANRASRMLALKVFESTCSSKLPLLSEEQRKRLLASSDFFQELHPYLQAHSPPLLQRLALHYLVLPFCQKVAPVMIQTMIEKGISQILSVSTPTSSFPGKFVSKKLEEMTTYFSVLHSVLKRTASSTLITQNLDKHIAEEFERVQAKQYSTGELYKNIAYKILDLGMESAQIALLAQCKKKPWYARMPGEYLVKTSVYCLRLSKRPLFWFMQSYVHSKIKTAPSHNLHNFVPPAHFAHPLIYPFFHFASHLLSAYLEKIQSLQESENIQVIDIDRTALKRCIQQHILLLGLCSSSSQDALRRGLEDSYLQRLLTEIQERFALDIAATQTTRFISILWMTLTQEDFLKNACEQLMASLSTNLVDDEPNPHAFSHFQDTFNHFRHYMLTTRVYATLDQAEQAIDRGLSWWDGWSNVKKAITDAGISWLGKPIKHALADRVIPIGKVASQQAIEKIIQFWTLPYNMRYGLHYIVLLPWLKHTS